MEAEAPCGCSHLSCSSMLSPSPQFSPDLNSGKDSQQMLSYLYFKIKKVGTGAMAADFLKSWIRIFSSRQILHCGSENLFEIRYRIPHNTVVNHLWFLIETKSINVLKNLLEEIHKSFFYLLIEVLFEHLFYIRIKQLKWMQMEKFRSGINFPDPQTGIFLFTFHPINV